MDRFQALGKRIESRLAELSVPSMVVGVAERGRPVWDAAFGFADAELGRPATLQTPYSLASITKPMAGSLLMALVEDGRIDLGKPANTYLGDSKLTAFEGDATQATVARLANHTAGLPLHFQFFFDGEPHARPLPEETIRRYGNIVAPPGEAYTYSNVGYGILGHLLSRAAKTDLRTLYQERLFAPLGMNRSFFEPTPAEFATCAVRYDRDRRPLPYFATDHPAASEAFASAEDLLSFGLSHLGQAHAALSKDSILRMQRSIDSSSASQGYGLGWALNRTPDGDPIVSHSGGMDGVSTALVIVPEREVVLVVLSNIDTPLTQEVVRELYTLLGIQAPTPPPAVDPQPMPDCLRGRWTGSIETYEGSIPFELNPDGEAFAYRNGAIEGELDARLPTSDAARTDHSLLIKLHDRGERLTGTVTARTKPGPRLGNALSYPVRLHKS